MCKFIVYPAIDLRFGEVVRLKQGKAEHQTVYSTNPVVVAKKWQDQGAEWLHVVNLNGAFGEDTKENERAIKDILSMNHKNLKIQFGGGIRSVDHVEQVLSLGIARVVIGTAVIENPDYGIEVLNRFGADKIAFGFDAVENILMTEGWQTDSGLSMLSLAKILSEAGAKTIIYTNIKKDGMQSGVDWENAKKLSEDTGLTVIASGGVATLDDIALVKEAGLSGVIVGRALYEENFTLTEAIHVG